MYKYKNEHNRQQADDWLWDTIPNNRLVQVLDHQHDDIEAVDVGSDGFSLLLLDVDKGLRASLGMPAANKMSHELVAHLIKEKDGTRLQRRVPVSCCSLQGGWKSSAQNGI